MQIATRFNGWMQDSELDWLFDVAEDKQLIIEFGSWHGRSTMAMHGGQNQGRIVCCDSWTTDSGLIWGPEHTQQGLPFRKFMDNFYCSLNWVIPYVIDLSNEALVECLVAEYGGRADMVFIDADHSREGVTRDIETARRLIRPGGLICGHDYGEGDWPGVKEAVDSAFAVVDNPVHTIWVGVDER